MPAQQRVEAAELLAAALTYAARGWRIIPLHKLAQYNDQPGCACPRKTECRTPGKHPIFGKWREVASSDPDKLRMWWRHFPFANIGILMGGQAGLICIDVDGEAGRESLAKLEETHYPLPPTLTQLTGREGGGEHRIFAVDQRYSDWIKNRQKLAPGIDVKTEGGLIVGAPSLHASGVKYRWVDPDQPIAAMPEWAFDFALSQNQRQRVFATSGTRPDEDAINKVCTKDKRIMLAIEALQRMPPAISGNNGHTATLRAANVVVRGFLVPYVDGTACDVLMEHYNPVCEPPWTEHEMVHKINSVVEQIDIRWGYRLSPRLIGGMHTMTPDDVLLIKVKNGIITTAPNKVSTLLSHPRPLASEASRYAPRLPSRSAMLSSPHPPSAMRVKPIAVEVVEAEPDFDDFD
jgi:hypothetical protein